MPCDYSLYHPEWKSRIRPDILKRACNCCEGCGVANYAVGYRKEDGAFQPTAGNIIHDLAGQGLSYPSLQTITYKEAKAICEVCNDSGEEVKYIVIVLTISHTDHDISNNDYSNLKALCNYCHLRHDVNHHKTTRAKSKYKQSFFPITN